MVPDKIEITPPESTEEPWTETIKGWPRLKAMLTDRRFWRDYESDVERSLRLPLMCSALGFIFGGALGGKALETRYKNDNKLTLYKGHIDYYRRTHEMYFFGFLRSGIRMSVRAFAVIGLFCGTQMFVTVYRNKTDFWDMWIAATVMAASRGIGHGPLGFLTTTAVGSILFGVPGSLVYHLVAKGSKRNEKRREWREKTRHEYRIRQIVDSHELLQLDRSLEEPDTEKEEKEVKAKEEEAKVKDEEKRTTEEGKAGKEQEKHDARSIWNAIFQRRNK